MGITIPSARSQLDRPRKRQCSAKDGQALFFFKVVARRDVARESSQGTCNILLHCCADHQLGVVSPALPDPLSTSGLEALKINGSRAGFPALIQNPNKEQVTSCDSLLTGSLFSLAFCS